METRLDKIKRLQNEIAVRQAELFAIVGGQSTVFVSSQPNPITGLPDTYTEKCLNDLCPRGGKPVEIVVGK